MSENAPSLCHFYQKMWICKGFKRFCLETCLLASPQSLNLQKEISPGTKPYRRLVILQKLLSGLKPVQKGAVWCVFGVRCVISSWRRWTVDTLRWVFLVQLLPDSRNLNSPSSLVTSRVIKSRMRPICAIKHLTLNGHQHSRRLLINHRCVRLTCLSPAAVWIFVWAKSEPGQTSLSAMPPPRVNKLLQCVSADTLMSPADFVSLLNILWAKADSQK